MSILEDEMEHFCMVKVGSFLRAPVKVEKGENSHLTFPYDFMNLAQLLPTFTKSGKTNQTPTFQLFPPIYRGKVVKVEGEKLQKHKGKPVEE